MQTGWLFWKWLNVTFVKCFQQSEIEWCSFSADINMHVKKTEFRNVKNKTKDSMNNENQNKVWVENR